MWELVREIRCKGESGRDGMRAVEPVARRVKLGFTHLRRVLWPTELGQREGEAEYNRILKLPKECVIMGKLGKIPFFPFLLATLVPS